MLNLLQRRGHRAKRVLLLRDILDSPKKTISVWKKNGYHEAIQHHYDKVLVVGTSEIYDIRKEYQFPESIHQKVHFCGYLARERSEVTTSDFKSKLGFQNGRLVLVTAGGGEDGYLLLCSYLKGLLNYPLDNNTKTLMICGPEMSESQRKLLVDLAGKCQNVIMQDFADDMMACMEAADLVVAMGGYNTTCELLSLKKRAILVPRIKPALEQWIRADRLAKLGVIRVIHPNELNPKLLIESVREELGRTNIHASSFYKVDMNGMQRISASISELLYENYDPLLQLQPQLNLSLVAE